MNVIPIPGYNLFLSTLAVDFDPSTMEMISFAYVVSKYGHAQQKRDDGGRYFDHPKAAAWIYIHELGGRDPRVICDLLLHDIKEDAYLLSIYRIKMNFGVDVARDILALTKLPKTKETIKEYLCRIIEQGPWAILAKLCDRLHNLRCLGACTAEKQERQIIETKETIMPTLIDALSACGGKWAEYASIMEKKMKEAMSQYNF